MLERLDIRYIDSVYLQAIIRESLKKLQKFRPKIKNTLSIDCCVKNYIIRIRPKTPLTLSRPVVMNQSPSACQMLQHVDFPKVSQLDIFYHKIAGYRLSLAVNLCEASTRQRLSSAKNSQNVTNRPRSHDATVASSVSYTMLIEQKPQNTSRQINVTSDRGKEGSSSRKKGSTGRNRGGQKDLAFRASVSGRRKEKERVLSNKSVQTIVVKQLRRVYIRVSLAGPRGGGRTEMTSPDRETDSRWPRLSKASFILGPRSRTPAAWNFFNWIHGVGPQRTVSQSCILLLLSTHTLSLSLSVRLKI